MNKNKFVNITSLKKVTGKKGLLYVEIPENKIIFWDSYGYIAGVTKLEYFEEIKNKINCTKKAIEEIPFGVKRAVTKTKDFCWIQDMKIIYKTKDNKLINFYSSYSCEFLIGIDTKLLSILSDEKKYRFYTEGAKQPVYCYFQDEQDFEFIIAPYAFDATGLKEKVKYMRELLS